MKNFIRHNEAHYIHFVTTGTYRNAKYFLDPGNCRILLSNIDFYRQKYRFKFRGFVIMPDHSHFLIEPHLGEADGLKPSANRGGLMFQDNNNRLDDGFRPSSIEDIMHDIKGKTAFDLRKRLKIGDKIWQKSFYDFSIYSDYKFEQKLNYIHNNPLKKGLVKNLDDYFWSSYQNYYLNNDTLIKIDLE